MAVKHLSYKDLPPDLRRKGAAEQRTRLAALLAHPFATPEQRADVLRSMEKLDLWERGLLPEPPSPTFPKAAAPAALPEALALPEEAPAPEAAPKDPVAHEVTITEKLSVKVES